MSQKKEKAVGREKRLINAYEDEKTELYLLFLRSVMPVFSSLNILLQSEEPRIHILLPCMRNFLQKLRGRLLVDRMADDVTDRANQLPDEKLIIGFTTKARLQSLEDSLSPTDLAKFFRGVRAFLQESLVCGSKKLPMTDPLLEHAQFISPQQKMTTSVDSVVYFVNRFPHAAAQLLFSLRETVAARSN